MSVRYAMHRDTDAQSLAKWLARDVAEQLRGAIRQRGGATLAVSGGSTPAMFFAELSRAVLPWAQVTITLIDERWVPPSDSASNERLVRRELLVHQAAGARWVGLYTAGSDPFRAEDECNEQVRVVPLPFDAAVLGLGEDGHTASWFPGGRNLGAALDRNTSRRCVATAPAFASPPRMTWTRAVVAASRMLALHFVGDAKWAVFERACRPGLEDELPVRAVFDRTEEPVAVYFAPY